MESEEQYVWLHELDAPQACDFYTFYLEFYRAWLEEWQIEMFEEGLFDDVSAQYYADMDKVFLDVLSEDMKDFWEVHGN